MENCNICNISILKKIFPRHEESQKHLISLQNYVPENFSDKEINEPNLHEPIEPTIYRRLRIIQYYLIEKLILKF